jgi:GTPase
MLPVIVLLGRPNVGKSTLFNYLTKTRDALVLDWPGVTRDRQYGYGKVGEKPYLVVDTGGLAEPDDPDMADLTDQQVLNAIAEADCIFFMVDAKDGLTAPDRNIAMKLRQEHRDKVKLLVNKTDRDDAATLIGDFYELGLGEPYAIAATMGRGIPELVNQTLSTFDYQDLDPQLNDDQGPRIAIVGRPNVGKSTLINRLLGEDRVVVCDRPGTTRDSIVIPYERQGKPYTLIDTAGVRRRARVSAAIEKFSVIKTLQAIELAHVVILVMDGHEDVTDQDLHLLGKVLQMGKALIIAFNKWDNIDQYDRDQFTTAVDRKLEFVDFARRYYISALHGTGVGKLYHAIDEAYAAVQTRISTAQITQALEKALKTHQPPLVSGRRIKLRYAHMGGNDPLVIVIHGKQVTKLPGSYQRYLVNYFRKHFSIAAIPIHLKLVNDDNPYV